MPCPCFIPTVPLVWPNAPKLPLGDAYHGFCQADAASPMEPTLAELKDLCNLGYARGRCPRFPPGGGPDAIRFAVAEHAGGVIHIHWVREKDHHPFDHGPLDYSVAHQTFTEPHPDAAVVRQAEAYIASYLRRKAADRREA